MLRVVAPGRVEIGPSVSDAEIDGLARDAGLQTLLISHPPDGSVWPRLNERLFARRPDVLLRVYGWYGLGSCDLGFASQMTQVERFAANSLRSAVNVEAIAEMKRLKVLGLGIFDLDSLAVLGSVSTGLEELGIAAMKSSKPDLAVLARFSGLRKLSVEKHKKNIEVISGLSVLEDVTLRSMGTNIAYLAPLQCLRDLDIKLGGITDLAPIAGKASIRSLELWQIRGLYDLGPVSTLTGLQHLRLESLPDVKTLPGLADLTRLRRVYLENMKELENLDALVQAPALEEVMHVSSGLSPEDHAILFRNPAIKRISAGFGNTRKNEIFAAMLRERGIGAAEGKFVFI